MATATPSRRTTNRVELQRRVRHPLQTLRGIIKRYVTLEGLGVGAVYIGLWFWIGLLLDWGAFQLFGFDWVRELGELSKGQATGGVLRAVLLGLLIAGLAAVVAWKLVWRLTREFSDPALALVLERRYPRELGDRLITAVELADPQMADKYGYSQELVDQTVNDAADRVERLPVRQVFNWPRLRRLGGLVVLLSAGLWLLAGAGYMLWGMLADQTATPTGYWYRFNAVTATWCERNLLLQNSYWPRNAYLEVVRFQDTKEHPDEMKLGLDRVNRPDLKVRAYQWVVLDDSSGDWRPLRWADLPGVLGSDMPAVNIDKDFSHWIIDLDDLDGSVAHDVLPADWSGKTSGQIRAALSPERKRGLERGGAWDAVQSLLTWQDWSVDKLALQMTLIEGKAASLEKEAAKLEEDDKHDEAEARTNEAREWRERRQELAELETVFARLNDLEQSGAMYRHLRKLDLPNRVYAVFYTRDRGKRIQDYSDPSEDDASKFTLPLSKDLKESVDFTARAGNFVTPSKRITFLPATAVTTLSVYKEEPAYLYWRLKADDQTPLKGLRQVFVGGRASVDAEETAISVPFGTRLVLRGQTDRPLKSIRVGEPQDHKGIVPDLDVPLENPLLADVLTTLVERQRKLKEAAANPEQDLRELGGDQAQLEKDTREAIEGARKDGGAAPEALQLMDRAARVMAAAHKDVFKQEMPAGNTEEAQKARNDLHEAAANWVKQAIEHLEDARPGFRLDLGQLRKTHDFTLEYRDMDGIEGRRRIKVDVADDQAPRIENLEPEIQLRTAKDRAGNKVLVRRQGGKSTTNTLLVTRHAILPMRGKVTDDISLTEVQWDYTVEQVRVRFSAPRKGENPKVPEVDVDIEPWVPFARALSTLQYTRMPGALALLPQGKLVAEAVTLDQKLLGGTFQTWAASVPLGSFQARLRDPQYAEPLKLDVIKEKLAFAAPAPKFIRQHDVHSESPGFSFPDHLKMIPISADGNPAGYFLVRLTVSAKDNNVETGPSIGRFAKEPFQFLVVSDNEFLSEIYKEELLHQVKLLKVLEKLKAERVRLSEQVAFLSSPEADLSIARVRADDTRKTLSETAAITREVKDAYGQILRELEVNFDRDRKNGPVEEKMKTTEKSIFGPLEQLFGQDRPFSLCEEDAQKLYEAIERGKNPAGDAATVKLAVECGTNLDYLIKDISKIVDSLEGGIVWGRVIDIAVELERGQKEAADRARKEYHRRLQELLNPGK